MAFSPNGRTLASGSWDNSIILWDVATQQPHGQPLKGHKKGIQSVTFSPDGKTLAVAGASELLLLDVASGEPRATLTGQTGRVTAVAYRPDGSVVAVASGAPMPCLGSSMSSSTRSPCNELVVGQGGTSARPRDDCRTV